MSDSITIRLIQFGGQTIEVDRDAYEQAKADGDIDFYLDPWTSDMETNTTIVEPDGSRAQVSGGEPYGATPAAEIVAKLLEQIKDLRTAHEQKGLFGAALAYQGAENLTSEALAAVEQAAGFGR